MNNKTSTQPTQRCGYVALLGRPNVGKSTLLNHVLQQKISITSRRPQTTRQNLLGVDTEGDCQAIYMDTPGIHSNTPRALNAYMVANAKSALRDVDVRVMLIEAGRWTQEDETVLGLLGGSRRTCIAVISKIDLLDNKNELLPQIQALHAKGEFAEIVPLCALKNEGVERFRQVIFSYLPTGSHLFGEDELTDQTERQLVEEIVREKLMRQIGDEIPHSAAVVVERFQTEADMVTIHADIYIERNSQKRIVIGKSGARLKLIGSEARKDIEALLQQRVMLHLWVRVRKGWTNNPQQMRRLGYD